MDANPAQKGFSISKSMATKGNYIAISIANRIVSQQLSLDKNEDEIEFSIGKKNRMYNVLITDLKAGKWIENAETFKESVTVNVTSCTVYFKSKGGMFTLKKVI